MIPGTFRVGGLYLSSERAIHATVLLFFQEVHSLPGIRELGLDFLAFKSSNTTSSLMLSAHWQNPVLF